MARLYNPANKQVYFWFDNTGHKPYCYTDLAPQAVEDKARRSEGFISAKTVELHDLLRDEPVKMTKVVGDNPLAIGGLPGSIRNLFVEKIYDPENPEKPKEISHAWEAAIRYQLCYTYDNKLVPGLMYKIENWNLIPCPPDVDIKTL